MLPLRIAVAFAATLMIVGCGSGEPSFSESPTTVPLVNPTTAPTPSTSTSTTSTTTTTTTVPEYQGEGGAEPRYDLPKPEGIERARCPDWWHTALEVGWTEEQLPTLDLVMWNESRCQADAHNKRSGDYGLVQVNRGFWELVAAEHGWTMTDMFDPRIGLAMGLIVYNAGVDAGWCGWSAWAASGNYCA